MCACCIDDQKMSTMHTLHNFVQQTDQMFPKQLNEAEHNSATVLAAGTKKVIVDTTEIAREDIECNEDNDNNKTTKDAIEEDENENIEVSALLMIVSHVHDFFCIHFVYSNTINFTG